MDVLKILWTNNKVVFSYNNKKEEIFIDDTVFVSGDKELIFSYLEKSVKTIGYSGFHVNVFYEGNNVEHDFTKAPLGLTKIKEVRQFIDHRIKSNDISPMFNKYMFSFLLGESNKDHKNILIDFFNMDFVHCLVYSFDKLGMSLDILSSVSPILSFLSKDIKSDSPFIVNYITGFGLNDFQFYCNNNNGIPSFIRYTPPYDNIKDINENISRSILYGKQQYYGVEPTIYLVGDYSKEVSLEEFPNYNISYMGDDSEIWNAIGNIKNSTESNVIPQSERGKKEQKQRFNFILFFILFGFLISVCFYFGTSYLLGQKESEAMKFNSYDLDLSKRTNIYNDILNVDKKNKAILRPYSDTSLRIIGNISDLFKDKIVLTRFTSIRSKTKEGYFVVSYNLYGFVFSDPIAAAKILKDLEGKISDKPFYFEITKSWKKTWLSNIETWKKNSSKNRSMKSGIKFSMSGNVYEH